MTKVNIPIHRCTGKTGEWRLSKKVIGKRGGVSWEKKWSQPATGGVLNISLEPGDYKVTFWDNGWPTSYEFTQQ